MIDRRGQWRDQAARWTTLRSAVVHGSAEARRAQLAGHGLHVEVYTNQGPKGAAIRRIVEEHAPGRVAFIDDLPQHHASAAEEYPDSIRLHLCGEPELAPHIDCAFEAGHAHARIDRWDEALPWLLERL